MRPFRLATRGSPLALRQTELVTQALQAAHPSLEVDVVVVRTTGDDSNLPLDAIGGQGVFVTEVERCLAEGGADAAIHSAKDMTSVMRPELMLGAVPQRADVRDGLVGSRFDALAPGAVIATGSARRRSQLAYHRPDLSFVDLRGNMDRRVSRGEDGSVGAVVVAVAAMERLGWMERLSDIIDPLVLLPQAGQGAIAVQCRVDDVDSQAVVAPLDHGPTHRAVRAERAVLAALGGSCSLPVAAWGTADGASMVLHGLVASGDGRIVIRMTRTGDDPDELGAAVAGALLEEGGARELDGFDRP